MAQRSDPEILAAYVHGEKLTVIPRKASRKLIVLRWLVERFAPGVRYTEAEVNKLIGQAHPDFATLRRELYDNHFLDRAEGFYWREGS